MQFLCMASSMVDSPLEIFLFPHSDMSSQHHFDKKLSQQIQRWLCMNCGSAFVWEMTCPWKRAQLVLVGRNTLFIKIKIKCPAGQNLEILTFRYLKTLVFDKFLKKLQHYLFYFWRILLVITNPPLHDYSTLPPPYTLTPVIHFRKIDMTTKNSGCFIRFHPPYPPPPHPDCSGGDDAMQHLSTVYGWSKQKHKCFYKCFL